MGNNGKLIRSAACVVSAAAFSTGLGSTVMAAPADGALNENSFVYREMAVVTDSSMLQIMGIGLLAVAAIVGVAGILIKFRKKGHR